jgi:1,4-alpha-glucan branching enzyme
MILMSKLETINGSRRKSTGELARPRKSSSLNDAPSRKRSDETRKEVVFQVGAPSAAMVALAADFTDWDRAPIRMLKLGDGIWQTKVALPQGRHRYKFLVDGQWLEDPHCPERVPNPFGTNDGVVYVP